MRSNAANDMKRTVAREAAEHILTMSSAFFGKSQDASLDDPRCVRIGFHKAVAAKAMDAYGVPISVMADVLQCSETGASRAASTCPMPKSFVYGLAAAALKIQCEDAKQTEQEDVLPVLDEARVFLQEGCADHAVFELTHDHMFRLAYKLRTRLAASAKPMQVGQKYFTIVPNHLSGHCEIDMLTWSGDSLDEFALKTNNVFRYLSAAVAKAGRLGLTVANRDEMLTWDIPMPGDAELLEAQS